MNAIAIVDHEWAIGKNGGLLFSLPSDMKRFRELTRGGTVILGRKTLDSFPGGAPLKGRRNIVVTRNEEFAKEGCEVAATPDEAVALTADTDPDRVWIIGGGSIYAALLSQCKRVYLTQVDASAEESDTFFPNLEKLPRWKAERVGEEQEENGLKFRFVDYVNTKL